MSVKVKTKIGTIDLTPTWTEVLPILLQAVHSFDGRARENAEVELKRMAHLADLYNKEHPK